MRDLRADLRERLKAIADEHAALCARLRWLEGREQRLRAFLRDEEVTDAHGTRQAPVSLGASRDIASGLRLREFVLKSLADGHEWALEALKEHALGIGLTTVGVAGRSLNIVLVNLHRQGLVTRVPSGKWCLQDPGRQLALELDPPRSACPDPNMHRRRA
jgi:hypothetical protein